MISEVSKYPDISGYFEIKYPDIILGQAYGSQGTLGARYYTMITDFKNLFVKDFQSLTGSLLHRELHTI